MAFELIPDILLTIYIYKLDNISSQVYNESLYNVSDKNSLFTQHKLASRIKLIRFRLANAPNDQYLIDTSTPCWERSLAVDRSSRKCAPSRRFLSIYQWLTTVASRECLRVLISPENVRSATSLFRNGPAIFAFPQNAKRAAPCFETAV